MPRGAVGISSEFLTAPLQKNKPNHKEVARFSSFLHGFAVEGGGTHGGGLAARLCGLFILSIFYNIFMQISIVFSKKVAKYTKKTQIVC
jgi:hypothetical protein